MKLTTPLNSRVRTITLLSLAVLTTTSLYAETLYGPGTINIPTNQSIIINMVGRDTFCSLDGQPLGINSVWIQQPRLAIAGPHALTITNDSGQPDVLMTFQRLKSSAIKTVIVSGTQTNYLNVPEGKTIQFFDPFNTAAVISIQPTNSSSSYTLFGSVRGYFFYTRPSATGPATVSIYTSNGEAAAISYYFVTRPRVPVPVDLIY